MAEEKYGLNKLLADIERDAQSFQRGISGVGGGLADTLRRDWQNTRAFLRSDASLASQIQPDFSPRGGPKPVDYTQIPRTSGGRAATGVGRRVEENRAAAAAAAQGTGGTGMGGGNPINALFAPMFADLKRQRQLANKRYEANRQQVTNIYGQITGARSEDIESTETAFKRLVDAASTRSTAVNEGIDASEAARLQQNQAALQGMGLEGLSTSQGDIASQTAAQAQQTNTLNSANWENMLRAMGATAGQQVQADIAGYNYAMAEDLGRLRGAREEFAQELGQQRGELRSQRAQATFEYQQAQQAAAAAAQAAAQRAKADKRDALARQEAEALKESGPVLRIVDAYQRRGVIPTPESAAKVINTVNEWFTNVPIPPGQTKWSASSAKASLLSIAGPNLTAGEQSAILAIFDEMDW
jgi:hypothetical protein